MCKCTSKRLIVGSVLFAILGAALLGVGVWLPRFVDQKFNDGLRDQLLVTKQTQASNTDGYRYWADNGISDAPDAIYYNIYMMNLTNHFDAVEKGAKPILNQTGPYVYRQITKRFDIVWANDSDGNPIVSWRPWIYYVFDSSRTPANLNPDDYVYSANIPLQGIISSVPTWVEDLLLPVYYGNVSSKADVLFTHRRIHDIIFGYRDEVLAKIPFVDPIYPGLLLNQTYDSTLHGPRFTMQTGENDWSLIRQYVKWGTPQIAMGYDYLHCNHSMTKTAQPAWRSDRANYVHGTDGLQFPPGVNKGSTLVQWFDVMFRAIPWVNYNDTEVSVNDITLYRFRIPSWTLDNITQTPSNEEYNAYGPRGFWNITSCVAHNVPIYLSKPHFFEAGDEVRDLVEGLSPDAALHDSYLDVEPYTGLAMRASKKLQINVKLKPVHTGKGEWFSKVSHNLTLPMIWIDGGSTIPDKAATQFKNSVYLARTVKNVSYYAGFAAGNFFILVGLIMLGYAVVVIGVESAPWGAAQRLISPIDDEPAGRSYRYNVDQPSGYRSTG